MPIPLYIAGGSVPGRAHLSAGRPNQDAIFWSHTDDTLIGVVCDGCSSGSRSEVGAQLGARLLVGLIGQELAQRAMPDDQALALAILQETIKNAQIYLLAHLRTLANDMIDPLQMVTAELFLFTVLGVVATATVTLVFALGDGFYAVNGELRSLGPFPGNAPPYLANRLIEPATIAMPETFALRTLAALPTTEVESVLLASDGFADVMRARNDGKSVPGTHEPVDAPADFWSDQRVWRNPDWVRRRLARMNRPVSGTPPLLDDDTTVLIVGRHLP